MRYYCLSHKSHHIRVPNATAFFYISIKKEIMNKTITGRDIRNQLKADLIGKDSYRGVTLTYTWLANQFGHISLGFIPTFILYIILSRYFTEASASFWSAVYISAAWFVFETFNFLGPLLLSNPLKKKYFY